MPVRLVLWDIDGTLIRTGGAGMKAFEHTFATVFGLRDATRTLKFSGRTDTSLVRECFKLHGIEPSRENFAAFFDVYPFWLSHLLRQLPGGICEGVLAFMAELVNLPRPPLPGLLTGNIRLGAELKLRHYDLWHRFKTGAFGDDHEDRNCIAGVARERGGKVIGEALEGDSILVIGDTPLDIACGQSIGARVLAVGTGNFKKAELAAAGATWAVTTLGEISAREVCA
jgi:phosphoglycolate phosphatase-like HAD superfamily hydrolase